MTTGTSSVTDELIELGGLRFHYRDWACTKVGAQDLVLLHGLGHHAHIWDRFAAAMASDYRVLALDQRGHGESQWAPPDQYRPDHLATDVAAFVVALGLSRFVWLGHSLGGRAAYTYAAKRPSALERLVIVDITPGTPATARERIFSAIQSTDTFDSPSEALVHIVALTPNADSEWTRDRVMHNLMRTSDGKWTFRFDRALRETPSLISPPDPEAGWRSVADISVPTLLVRGEESDVVTSESRDRMVAAIPGCRLIEVPGAGHNVVGERPQAFLDAVRTFL